MFLSSSASAAHFLSGFKQLSASVYLYEPPDDATASYNEAAAAKATGKPFSRPDPKLIILLTWMSARPLHISKYISGYRAQCPNSRILLIRSEPADFFYRSTRTQRRQIAPAISVIIASCVDTDTNFPSAILHIFSNGGSHQTRNLLLAYGESTPLPFPQHVTILDSCPGRGTFKRSVRALSSALPSFPPFRLVLFLLIYAAVSVYWVYHIPFGIPDPIERIRQFLNSPVAMHTETNRCYIYSEADSMVGWDDVDAHVADAARRGFMVRTEKFEGSEHCAHVRVGGGERYWKVVEDVWHTERRR